MLVLQLLCLTERVHLHTGLWECSNKTLIQLQLVWSGHYFNHNVTLPFPCQLLPLMRSYEDKQLILGQNMLIVVLSFAMSFNSLTMAAAKKKKKNSSYLYPPISPAQNLYMYKHHDKKKEPIPTRTREAAAFEIGKTIHRKCIVSLSTVHDRPAFISIRPHSSCRLFRAIEFCTAQLM